MCSNAKSNLSLRPLKLGFLVLLASFICYHRHKVLAIASSLHVLGTNLGLTTGLIDNVVMAEKYPFLGVVILCGLSLPTLLPVALLIYSMVSKEPRIMLPFTVCLGAICGFLLVGLGVAVCESFEKESK
ncbi:hypothetical protein L596_019586 [Steinernema carpocapsae]|uniref:Uncharacterized protein n=1 Tax=Steinernema carpocapsae TaxID=34508 RepID=A0A4U5MQY9_STECR|nr:hypothetical protein L596_019586 [Steinernema carpocapsae]